jgi:hypothetical protein
MILLPLKLVSEALDRLTHLDETKAVFDPFLILQGIEFGPHKFSVLSHH